MTKKFIGNIKFFPTTPDMDGITSTALEMPNDTNIPPKKDWHEHPIWEFNGKTYKPITEKAKDDLNSAIKAIQAKGFTAASKKFKRKPSSIRYAILTTGVEDFYFVK